MCDQTLHISSQTCVCVCVWCTFKLMRTWSDGVLLWSVWSISQIYTTVTVVHLVLLWWSFFCVYSCTSLVDNGVVSSPLVLTSSPSLHPFSLTPAISTIFLFQSLWVRWGRGNFFLFWALLAALHRWVALLPPPGVYFTLTHQVIYQYHEVIRIPFPFLTIVFLIGVRGNHGQHF